MVEPAQNDSSALAGKSHSCYYDEAKPEAGESLTIILLIDKKPYGFRDTTQSK